MENKKDKIKRILYMVIKIMIILQIIIAFLFTIKNINYVPEYGDTPEYIKLAETMKLDDYRPFIYPLFLKLCLNIAKIVPIGYMNIVYIIQNLVSLLSCFAIIKALLYVFDKKMKKGNQILYTLYLWSMPFNIHFNMTILSDSFAISFTILFLTTLVYYLKNSKKRYVFFAILTMFIASNIRSEKIYFFIMLLLAIIIIEILLRIKKKENNIKVIIGTITILVIGTITSLTAKSLFQTETEGREQQSVSLMVYERIVSDNLAKYYEQLPEDIKQVITKEEAEMSVTHPNNYKTVYSKLYQLDGNTDRIYQIIKTILKLNYSDLMKDITCDFFKNVFPMYFQLFDNTERSIDWTITRMQGEHFVYTNVYILYDTIVFILINVMIILKLLGSNFRISVLQLKNIAPYIWYILISAGFFSCFTAFNFHIRYAMPICMIEMAFMILLMEKEERKKLE